MHEPQSKTTDRPLGTANPDLTATNPKTASSCSNDSYFIENMNRTHFDSFSRAEKNREKNDFACHHPNFRRNIPLEYLDHLVKL